MSGKQCAPTEKTTIRTLGLSCVTPGPALGLIVDDVEMGVLLDGRVAYMHAFD